MYIKTTWVDRIVQYPRRFTLQNNGDGTTTLLPSEGTITSAGTAITATNMNRMETAVYEILLREDNIKGTTQSYTITDGEVTQVLHKEGATTIRTDNITYTSTLITEVRTLNTGETLTFKYHLTTDGDLESVEVI